MASRNIVVVLGSPRKKGNSTTLAKQVVAGAESAGAQVETFFLQDMDIHACRACDGARRISPWTAWSPTTCRSCIPSSAGRRDRHCQPIYWFTVSAQTKLFMDRCYALAGRRVTPSAASALASF